MHTRLRRALGFTALAAALALGAGCRKEAPPPAASADTGASWFVLRHGLLELLQAPPDASALSGPNRFLPWTLQARIADLTVRDGTLYAAVNGYGLASSPFPPPAASRFATAYADEVFAGRTISEILTDSAGMFLHLYVDHTLAAGASEVQRPRGLPICLVAVRDRVPGDLGSAFGPIPVPFHASHPTWEAVSIVRTSATELALEWKRSGDERTEFAYTRLSWRGATETVIDRATFRDAYNLRSVASAGVDPAIRALFEAILPRASPEGGAAATAVHLVVRSDGEPASRYRHQPPGYAEAPEPDLISVPARKAGSAVWALTADGTLLSVIAGRRDVRAQSLPALPPSCRYTGFVLGSDGSREWIAASWEQIAFTRVGTAGLYVGPVGPPAP